MTDLLEAQSARFAAEQNRQIATYRFLLDYIEFQRSIAWFEIFKTEQEKADMARRLQEAVQ